MQHNRMKTETHHKLELVLKRLQELGNGVADLAQKHADVLDSPDIQDALCKFRQAYEESKARLENPNFTIATIGTTSSGKSTIVNALIGRKIAPIEAGEMSGGVLTIKHSKEFKLSIAETDGAQWNTGTWANLSDSEIYDRIRYEVMDPYHNARQKQELAAPQVTVHVPILPSEDPSLLSLPEGIGIELIDLPGLKSTQDRDNLKVIQQQVPKAFSLVALDYSQVDDQNRKRLLRELKKVVQYLNGRTDSMIFILNRVDQRGQDDIALDERIKQLQLEIKETLNLNELPDIIPLCGRLLYYAQCAWGATAINNNSYVDAATRQYFLSGMLDGCRSLTHFARKNEEFRKWLRDLEDLVYGGEVVSDEKMKEVLFYVYDLSGGKRLWDCMRDRVQESFSELVIVPALINFDTCYQHLIQVIKIESDIKKIHRKEALEEKRRNICDGSEKLLRDIEDIRDELTTDVERIIKALKTGYQPEQSKAGQHLQNQGYEGFFPLTDGVREVEGDLAKDLILPVRDAFMDNEGCFELEEQLSMVIPPPKAKAIAKAYNLVNRKLSKFEQNNSGNFVWKVRQDEIENIRRAEQAQKAILSLYFAMRQAILTRAEFSLQGQAKEIEKALKSLIEKLTHEINIACQQELPDFELNKVLITNLETFINQNPPELPEELFHVAADIQTNSTTQQEVVGTQSKEEKYKEGSCFKKEKTRVVAVDVCDDVKYQKVQLPGYKMMAQDWVDGIAKEKEKLWDILDNWISSYLELLTKECNRSINKTIKFTERSFDRQVKLIEHDDVKQSLFWNAFNQELDLVEETYQKLKLESF